MQRVLCCPTKTVWFQVAHGGNNCNSQRYTLRDFVLTLDRPLSVLKLDHIKKIDDALAELGPSGEARIIKQRGKLRFIQKVESMSIIEGTEK